MPAKINIIPGQRFSSLVIIKEVERVLTGKERRRAVKVVCDCGHEFIVRYNALVTGNTTSCGCTGKKYVTPKNRKEALLKAIEGKSFYYLDESPINEGTQVLKFYCLDCNSVFKRDFNSCVNKKYDCPSCPRIYNVDNEDQYMAEVNKLLENNTLMCIGKQTETQLRYMDNLLFKCSECHTTLVRRYDVFLKSPNCYCKIKHGFNTSKQAVLYLFSLSSFDGVVCFKYGITNNFPQRFNQFKCNNKNFVFNLIELWDYEDGSVCLEHEKIHKRTFKSYLTKTLMPDGYTETLDKLDLDEFITSQEILFGGVL